MINLEVVKRLQPCRWFRSNPTSTRCRSCQLLIHIRYDGTETTFCGHDCGGEGWYVLPDTHPEDIDQLERCTVCYMRFHKEKESSQ